MSSLDNRRTWVAGGAVTALLIGVASWFLLVSPKFAAADTHRSDAAATRLSNLQLADTVRALQKDSAHMGLYTAQLRSALAALPLDNGLPSFTRQLALQATANHVSVTSLVVGDIAPVVTTATAPTDASSTASATSDSATSTTTTPATTGTTGSAVAGALYSIQVTVQTVGGYVDQVAFAKSVQTAGTRRALVIGSSIGPAGNQADVSLDRSSLQTLTVQIFSTPQTPDQIAVFEKLLSGKVQN